MISSGIRCRWAGTDPDYIHYHDTEWGRPCADPRYLFEKICLEGFQAGLSWLTILKKRENFRAAFDGFDAARIAAYGTGDIERLMANPGIVRHRAKIESVINNARRALELPGGIASHVWRFAPMESERPERFDADTLRGLTQTPSSIALSKDMKRRGWSFVGPVTMYAFMQAVGMVNDHEEGCPCRAEIEDARAVFIRPFSA